MRRIGLAVLLSTVLLQAATVDDMKRDCVENHSFGGFKNCVIDLFTGRPVQIVAASVVPGGGVAMGLRYTQLFNKGAWQNDFSVTGASSIRAFWFTDAKLTMTRRPFGVNNTARDRFAVRAFVKTRNLPQLPYYGIGPNTSITNRVDYEWNDQQVGATVSNPLSGWLAVGGTLESIWTQVNGISNAPGATQQPTMLHSEVFVRPHFGSTPPYVVDYKIGYNWYHDTGTGIYSFSRFITDLNHNLYLERPGGTIRRDSVLNLRAYFSTSMTSGGNRVPFYFQETLGGSDVYGNAALRGFRDYRFRGPHVVLFQAEYSRRIWGPIGALAFYDAGTVGVQRSDLDLTNLRHSFGGGLALYLADKIVFKAYIGLGSGEGRHPYFGVPPGVL